VRSGPLHPPDHHIVEQRCALRLVRVQHDPAEVPRRVSHADHEPLLLPDTFGPVAEGHLPRPALGLFLDAVGKQPSVVGPPLALVRHDLAPERDLVARVQLEWEEGREHAGPALAA